MAGSESARGGESKPGSRAGWWVAGGCLVLVLLLGCCACSGLVGLLAISLYEAQPGDTQALLAIPSVWPPAAGDPAIPESEEVPGEPGSTLGAGSPIGQVAPDFAVRDVTGREWRLSELRGRPVVVNFWATWCPPCREEMPALEASWKGHRDQGLVILAANLDESESQVAAFADRLKLTLPVVVGGQSTSLGESYRVRYLPTTYFINQDGVIQAYVVGGMARREIERNLAKIGVGP